MIRHKKQNQFAKNLKYLGYLLTLLAAPAVLADHGVISGSFRGTELKISSIGSNCDDFDPSDAGLYFYRVVGNIQASATGAYTFSDVGHHYDLDVVIGIYTDFNPASPLANQVGTINDGPNEPDGGTISLTAGVSYVVVIQAFCGNDNKLGSWAVSFSGPGTITGDSVYASPAFTLGSFNGTEPQAELFCGTTFYQVSNAIQVPVSGEYFFSDASLHFAVDVSVVIYRDSFNVNTPQANLVAAFDDGGSVQLEVGVDYFFVVQPLCENATGQFQYVLLGPGADFVITEGVSGAWANFDTLGQGFFMEAYPGINLLFVAWFTWDTTQPDASETAQVGDSNHRWVTSQGGFSGDTATLNVTLTRGGLFDDPTPTNNTGEGTMTIRFIDCNTAIVTYNFTAAGVSGSFTIKKISQDNTGTCTFITNLVRLPIASG